MISIEERKGSRGPVVAVVARGGSAVVEACVVALLSVITVATTLPTRNEEHDAGGIIAQNYSCQVSPWS